MSRFEKVDFVVHIAAAVEIILIAVSAVIGVFMPPLPPADATQYPHVPIWLLLFLGTLVESVALFPALWVLVIQFNRRQTGCRTVGLVLLAFGCFIGFGGFAGLVAPEAVGAVGNEALLMICGSGILAVIGTFFLVYATKIYELDIGLSSSLVALPQDEETEGEPRPAKRLSAAAKKRIELRNRLSLFGISVLLALVAAFLLNLVPSLREQPVYIFYSFIGVLLLGMTTSGLINEETLSKWVPWIGNKDSKSSR